MKLWHIFAGIDLGLFLVGLWGLLQGLALASGVGLGLGVLFALVVMAVKLQEEEKGKE